MKAKIRIPTKEYAFIEATVEGETHEIVQMHDELFMAVGDKEGLNFAEWAKARDRYITKNELDPEVYETMSKPQKFVINEVKKTFKSIIRKENE